jgi:hypothetical protein
VRRALPWIITTAAYAALVLWLTWPLAPSCVDHLPDPVGLLGFWGWTYLFDLQFTAWALAWDVHALLHAPARLFAANIFHPAPYPLAYSDHFLGMLPLAAPAYLLSGSPVCGFNAALLGGLLGCALAMHALVVRWTGSHVAAFGAGLVYAFNTWRTGPAFSLQVIGAPYLPLVVLFFERWTERRRPGDLAAVVACVVLQTLASYYLGYAAFLVLGLGVAAAVASRRVGPRALVQVVVAIGVAVAVVGWVSLPYVRLSRAGLFRAPTLEELRLASAASGMLSGGRLAGLAAMLLAVVGVVARSRPGARVLCVFLLVGGVLSAAGPVLRVAGASVPLPYGWLLGAVPGLAFVRYPVRFVSVVALGFAGLVGLGLVALARGAGWRRVAAPVCVVLLVWHVRGATRMAVRRVPPPEKVSRVYRTLAATPEDGVLLELPLSDEAGAYREAEYVLLSTGHWKTLLNGYSGYVPPTYVLVRELARRLPDPAALQRLVDLTGLRWVIVHAMQGRPPQAWSALEQAGTVRRLAADPEAILYEVAPTPRLDLAERARRDTLEPAHETLLGTPLTRLEPAALEAEWDVGTPPARLRPRQRVLLPVTVRNATQTAWPGYGVRAQGLVVVQGRWLPADAPGRAADAGTAPLLADVGPGASAETVARFDAPAAPGRYTLELALRQMGDGGAVGPPHAGGATTVEAAATSAPRPAPAPRPPDRPRSGGTSGRGA